MLFNVLFWTKSQREREFIFFFFVIFSNDFFPIHSNELVTKIPREWEKNFEKVSRQNDSIVGDNFLVPRSVSISKTSTMLTIGMIEFEFPWDWNSSMWHSECWQIRTANGFGYVFSEKLGEKEWEKIQNLLVHFLYEIY